MISVIVPVYNVESYLRKCLDSVTGQTYRNLEILVIDDGSTDGSGKICDEYKKDNRVKVFHTENRGLSCARNIGLDNATGEWIGFVDSDDWIEPDMYEVLIERALETGADIVECGEYIEYSRKTINSQRQDLIYYGKDSLLALLRQDFSDGVWNKVWRRRCFNHIRFPKGRIYEDVAVTYQVFDIASCVCTISKVKYHYIQREKSLSKTYNMKNLVDYWSSCLERYEYLNERQDCDIDHYSLQSCAMAIARTWAYYYKCSEEERESLRQVIYDMLSFSRQHIPMFGYRDWTIGLRIGVLFTHSCAGVSLRMAWLTNIIWKKISGRMLKATDSF